MLSNDKPVQTVALQSSLLVILSVVLWRTLDFVDEWQRASFQMTLGQSRLTGEAALITQLLIITALALCAGLIVRRLLAR